MVPLEELRSLDIAMEVFELLPGGQVEVVLEGGEDKLLLVLTHR